MTLSSLSSATNATQAAEPSTRKTTLTQEDFLNIFTTQLKYQNPLEPLDNNQMASQMAQFSTLDALYQSNQILEAIATNQTSMHALEVSRLIGKKVETVGNRLFIDTEKVSEGYYQLSKAGRVTIQIYDANGNLIRTLEEGTQDNTKQKLVWDGKNQQGVMQPDGAYTFRVSAVDEKGQAIQVDTHMTETIKGVSFEEGVIYLNSESRRITLSDILTILG
jgi:flagellar basal-body rod modification protein FlgD